MTRATILLLLSFPSLAFPQGSRSDYQRAANLAAMTRDKVFRDRLEPHWIDQERLWYHLQTGADRSEFVLVNAATGVRQAAFDHARLATALAAATGEAVDATNLPFRILDFSGDAVSFSFSGSQWTWHLANNQLTKSAAGKATHDPLSSLTDVRRSRGGGKETHVRFINQMAQPVVLFWIDTRGRRTEYQTIAAGKTHDQRTFSGHVWLVTTTDKRPVAVFQATADRRDAVIDGKATISAEEPASGGSSAAERGGRNTSPDGKWQALIRDHNVFLHDVASEQEVALSNSGTEDDPFISRFSWSPDARRLVAIQQSLGERREISLIESAPEDQLQPKLHTVVYAKPGDKLPVARPRLFDVASQRQIPVSEALFPNAWRISSLRWQANSQRFTFLYNQRGHQVLRIVVVDADTGETAALVDEQSKTFIDYAHKTFAESVEETNELIWMSERDGWNHLYLYDSRTGQLKHQITRGPWVVRGVERIDPMARRIWLRASGIYPEQDPYYIHYAAVDFDGSDFTLLTEGNGTHTIEYSPDRKYFVDTYSRVDMPPVTELRRSHDGSRVCLLEQADWSQLLATGWRPPRRFTATGRDGTTHIYGVIYLPTKFDPESKYPVIEKIYAGPHGSFVPKSFASFRRDQTYAELGFIVVQIDGMGTSHRSKAFHDVCWQNLGDSGFPDRILWMQAAAKEIPQMDLSRVGVFGGSAGGQSALRALLAFGDFYKVAVADCGCHDNRMDKVWWNELWMGWPVGPHYEEQSNVTQAHRLRGKLLLTVGELDRNVDPASTMQVVDALIKADKDFDLLVVPAAGHGVGERPYANRRRQDFFVRHLWGKEPRH